MYCRGIGTASYHHHEHEPWLGETLTLEGSRERIESGWWDGRDIARDYFIARNRRGECFWIYRELATQSWWLHGVFG